MSISRRHVLQIGLISALFPWASAVKADAPHRGGRLIIGVLTEPTMLTSGISTDGMAQQISSKIFDGLVTYDDDLSPQPQLATAWETASDQLSLTLHLRPGVKWHDGKPFTSADVAFSALELWKKFHSRGRSTFANVTAVETPDSRTAVFRLSKPAPYLLSALAASESQVLPRHLYEGTDILINPRNVAPVGTGPFRFLAWERGQYIALERNGDYWDQPKPYLDQVIFRVLPDPAAMAVALETGEIQLGSGVPPTDIQRLSKLDTLAVDPPALRSSTYTGLAFNLDRGLFHDVRVRRAVAHAIDQSFILERIYHGYGIIGTGPFPPQLKPFYTPDVPRYPYDLERANALLDEAGLKPDSAGVRLSATFVPQMSGDTSQRQAEYIKEALGKVGIELKIETSDFASFVRRIYTDRNFDLCTYTGSAGPDPAIGTQRIFWSKNYKRGVAFSNVAHYASPDADGLLETAQIETNPQRRIGLYNDFQRVVQTDLPLIPLIIPQANILRSRNLTGYRNTADGALGNFAETQILPE